MLLLYDRKGQCCFTDVMKTLCAGDFDLNAVYISPISSLGGTGANALVMFSYIAKLLEQFVFVEYYLK